MGKSGKGRTEENQHEDFSLSTVVDTCLWGGTTDGGTYRPEGTNCTTTNSDDRACQAPRTSLPSYCARPRRSFDGQKTGQKAERSGSWSRRLGPRNRGG